MKIYTVFFTAIWQCPNFEPLSRGQPHSPDVNHFVLHIRTEGHRESRNEVGPLSLAVRLMGSEQGNLPILITTP